VRSSVDVHNFLLERDVPHELVAASGRLRSPERIASILGLPAGDVGKVSVLEGEAGPVAALVPAGCEPDPDRVAAVLNEVDMAYTSESRAAELAGYLVETIPPVGLPNGFRVVADRSIERDSVLYFPGGEPRAVLKVRGIDLLRATGALVSDIIKPAPAPSIDA